MTQTQLSLAHSKGLEYISGFTADDISKLLAEKHKQDVFVAQCKNGETWGSRNLLILDAWALKRTYSPLTMIGYEIKVSRQDFEQDQKWTGYMDLCNYFFFVCPAGLIRATDLPHQVGLIWVSQTGTLHTKHKAERIVPDTSKLNDLLIYIMMARTKITNTYQVQQEDSSTPRVESLRKVVEEAESKQKLAYFVKTHIKSQEERLEKKEHEIQNREYTIKSFTERLARLGITWNPEENTWQDNQRVERQIDVLRNAIDPYHLTELERTANSIITACKTIRGYYKPQDNPLSPLG